MASVFMGDETDGLDRIAGFFQEGQFTRYAMIANRHVVVFDTYGHALYTETGATLPEGFIPKSIQVLRSRQTGKLVAGIGGFMAGGSKQRGCIIATDYVMQE